jgi:hypothetical protein
MAYVNQPTTDYSGLRSVFISELAGRAATNYLLHALPRQLPFSAVS